MPNQKAGELVERPPWLEEHSDIKALLLSVLKKYESKGTLNYKITKKTLPDLFGPADTADTTWFLLQQLCNGKTKIFYYDKNERRSNNRLDYEYLNQFLCFQPETEKTLRQWLNVPSKKSGLELWRSLITNNLNKLNGDSSKLAEKVIYVEGRSQQEIINGFVKIKEYLNTELTLRNLSSCCFWQDSKFLDEREDLVVALYPEINILCRPVLVNVYLPEKVDGILFIENQDNYTQGIKGMAGISEKMKNLALVFSYGNKLSAERVRNNDGVSFHFDESSHFIMKESFNDFWYGNTKNWPVYFWGDLDNSGMDILLNLKKNFDVIEAWQPGYKPMLKLLENNEGHSALQSGKQNQKPPSTTGCYYADNTLIPALKKYKRFIDQECIL